MQTITFRLPSGESFDIELSELEWEALQFLTRRDGVSLEELVYLAIESFIGADPIVAQGKGRPS